MLHLQQQLLKIFNYSNKVISYIEFICANPQYLFNIEIQGQTNKISGSKPRFNQIHYQGFLQMNQMRRSHNLLQVIS